MLIPPSIQAAWLAEHEELAALFAVTWDEKQRLAQWLELNAFALEVRKPVLSPSPSAAANLEEDLLHLMEGRPAVSLQVTPKKGSR